MDVEILEQEFSPKEIKKRKGPHGKMYTYPRKLDHRLRWI